MGTVTVVNHLTLDGVIQAPAHPDEDRRGGFEHGGWASEYFDDVQGEYMGAREIICCGEFERDEDADEAFDNALRPVVGDLLALARDGLRYRWLRTEATRIGHNVAVCVTFNIGHDWIQIFEWDGFDAAINTAMKED